MSTDAAGGEAARRGSYRGAALLDEREQLRAALLALAEWGPLAESLDVVEFRLDVSNALKALGKVT